jgi:hypothetical protein
VPIEETGEAFEKRLNDARTSINLPGSVVEHIVSIVSDEIQSREKDQIEKIKIGQVVDLDSALRENPILRLGLRGKTSKEYVATRPNTLNDVVSPNCYRDDGR